MSPEDPNFSGNHRRNMVQSLEDSLESLGTDYVDLCWLHAWDCLTPIDEVMRPPRSRSTGCARSRAS